MRHTPHSYGLLLASMAMAAHIPPELLPDMPKQTAGAEPRQRDPERERREAQAREVRQWNEAVEQKKRAKMLARHERKRG